MTALKATKEQVGTTILITLAGPIDENANLNTLIGDVSGELVINGKDVSRVNSVGIKSWIKFFTPLTTKGITLRFIECSTAMVEQFSLISRFASGGTVESIYVPFMCGSCKTEMATLYKTEDLKALGLQVPDAVCTACGKPAQFDDVSGDYLHFLSIP